MKRLLPILALATIIGIAGCSDKKTTNPSPNPGNTATSTWDAAGGFWQSVVNGSSSDSYKYFSFATRETVVVDDAQAASDTTWDIAFKRTIVKLNSGISGPKGIKGVDLEAIGSPNGVNFPAVQDTSGVTSTDWIGDYYDYAVDEWLMYNPNTHQVSLTNYVYTLKDAAGKYVKFQVSDMFGGGQPPDMGSIVIRYVYAASGSDISGPGVTDTITAGSDTAYFDFSTGEQVTPADPANSLDWDFAVAAYDIHLNSNLFGPGEASAYLVTDSGNNPRTDFDSILVAETQPQAYTWDNAGSAFTGWYDYDPNTHQLSSFGHVYLIKIHSDVYKVQIQSYYHNVNGMPASGWYTYKWLKLYQ